MNAADDAFSLSGVLWDLARFDILVSPYLLIGMYYLGALGAPLAFGVMLYKVRGYRRRVELPDPDWLRRLRAGWQRWSWRIKLLLLLGFVMAELAWRMMFEFLLAYLQMRDYLAALNAA